MHWRLIKVILVMQCVAIRVCCCLTVQYWAWSWGKPWVTEDTGREICNDNTGVCLLDTYLQEVEGLSLSVCLVNLQTEDEKSLACSRMTDSTGRQRAMQSHLFKVCLCVRGFLSMSRADVLQECLRVVFLPGASVRGMQGKHCKLLRHS